MWQNRRQGLIRLHKICLARTISFKEWIVAPLHCEAIARVYTEVEEFQQVLYPWSMLEALVHLSFSFTS